ncbi:putative dehydrogenase [Diaminobutyricimonas aerilata]|uniref:Putative dehydrogenase n=1 Tax=Diaminobutyricimonas aerilata TaxID=1162967 RepID=A0A2M9CKN6_9MICO|nr:Gfo/Idh/MocA family oxidoreductase [Diaminobutyricimonas aerilata]PJJ72447.1 putative dehydrogenase [Diaminobutyricimonas aerilata]
MISIAVAGIGKMGLSHLAMVRAHPDVDVVGVCDSAGYLRDVLGKYTGLPTFADYTTMLDTAKPDAVLIATPTGAHVDMVRAALDRGIHVFCEKPLSLSAADSLDLVARAEAAGVVTAVGYHNRFVGAFREVKRVLDSGAIGDINHALAESYGPVVLRPKGATWRSRRTAGGGCLYDYAAHPLDLLAWYLGEPAKVSGTALGSIFSAETDDEVYSLLHYPAGPTAHLSVNWSDESQRKMTTRITLWGSKGKIVADRQEIQVYLRDTATPPEGYHHGWNVHYTTELTDPVWFYLRGEEYSAQLDHFVRQIQASGAGEAVDPLNDFASALVTDEVIEKLLADAAGIPATAAEPAAAHRPARRPFWSRRHATV